jgi:hypothetical protein
VALGRALSQVEIIAQSMANISPTAGPAMVVPLVIASSGDAAWITFLVATAAVILISVNINLLARSSASPGSLYGLVREHFGRWPSIIAGWSLLIAYIGTAAAVTGGITNYCHALLSGSPQPSVVFTTSTTSVCILAACWLAYRDVRLSVQLMLWLEAISIGLILVLFFLPGPGSALHFDQAQLVWRHFGRHQVQSGLLLAIFSFVGFESATAMGAEAADPLRTIPRAVWMTALFSGAFFLLSAYSENLGLKGMLGDLSVAGAPLQGASAGDGSASRDAAPRPLALCRMRGQLLRVHAGEHYGRSAHVISDEPGRLCSTPMRHGPPTPSDTASGGAHHLGCRLTDGCMSLPARHHAIRSERLAGHAGYLRLPDCLRPGMPCGTLEVAAAELAFLESCPCRRSRAPDPR